MCNTPNTDPFGNVIRSCYCEAEDIAAAQSAEFATLRAENERLREALEMFAHHYPRGINPYLDRAASLAKEALK